MTESSCLANLSKRRVSPCQIVAQCLHCPEWDPTLTWGAQEMSVPHPQQRPQQRCAGSWQPGHLPRSSDGAGSRGDVLNSPSCKPLPKEKGLKPPQRRHGAAEVHCGKGRGTAAPVSSPGMAGQTWRPLSSFAVLSPGPGVARGGRGVAGKPWHGDERCPQRGRRPSPQVWRHPQPLKIQLQKMKCSATTSLLHLHSGWWRGLIGPSKKKWLINILATC